MKKQDPKNLQPQPVRYDKPVEQEKGMNAHTISAPVIISKFILSIFALGTACSKNAFSATGELPSGLSMDKLCKTKFIRQLKNWLRTFPSHKENTFLLNNKKQKNLRESINFTHCKFKFLIKQMENQDRDHVAQKPS